MLERALGYKGFGYEDWLIEYNGTVINNGSHIISYASPGVQVTRGTTGNYDIVLLDKVPIWPAILGQPSPYSNWYNSLNAGFADTLQIFVNIRGDQVVPGTAQNASVSAPQLYGANRVLFAVRTSSGGVAADVSFSFQVFVTGQPQRFVFGLGA